MKLSVKTVCGLFCATLLCAGQSTLAEPHSEAQAGTTIAPVSQTPPPSNAATERRQEPGDASAEPAPQKRPSAQQAAAAGGAEVTDTTKRYIIGPLDVLFIKVWNSPNLSGPVEVGPDGILSMSLIGDVKADGMTREQLKEVITKKLTDFLNNPEVDVTVARVNSKRYFIIGGVNRAGEFPLVRDTTVLDALATAGGFKDFANLKKIYVLRNGQRFYFNYKDFSKGKNMEQNILLQNGDRIFVPE